MRTDPRADEVRNIVERVFSGYLSQGREQRGIADLVAERPPANRFPRIYEPPEDTGREDPQIEENILIDDGRYVARTYRTEHHMAMWLVGVGIVQFYDDRGRMLATVNLFESLRPQKMAA